MAEAGPAAAAASGGEGGGGGPSSSPKSYENLILSNLSSPRFDISDFLKTPTDGSPRDEPMYCSTFPPYTMPHPPPLSLPPFVKEEITTQDDGGGPSAIAPACTVPDASFSNALLFEDCKGGDLGMDHVLQTGDLIPFDEYIDGVLEGRDAFSLFNDVQYNTGANNAPSALGYVPYIHTDNANAMLPALSVPPVSNGIYAQHEPYLGSEPGGLAEVDERVLVSLDHGALSSAASNLLMYPNNQIDWGMSNTGASTYPLNLGQQSSLQCENCQLLRRIIHSNGVQDTKLEIHGQQGQSYHAVLQTRFCIDDGFPSSLEQQMVDFPVGNCEYVKQFLMQYSMLRSKEGFILRHDSLQVPMDLSCIAPERVLSAVSTQMSNQTGQNKMNQGNCSTDNADPSVMPVKPPKSNAAAQRERTGKLKMSDLAQFFHLPINAAAKELGICPTVLKKICRRNGMRRWPHRKIKSIERIIATLEQTIAEGAGQGDESIRMEIAMLRNERAQLCAGLLGEK